MTPQEIGAFIAVMARPFGSMPTDDTDMIVDENVRVKSHHIVLFDYNPGGGERAIKSQAAPATGACMVSS
jgi:hypothetical protein